ILAAIHRAESDLRPSLIAVRTHIGYGSPNKQDSQKAHGNPLGEDEVRLTKQAYGWDPDKQFYIPEAVRDQMGEVADRGEPLAADWHTQFEAYREAHPARARELKRRLDGDLPKSWDSDLKTYAPGSEMGTRNASQEIIQVFGERVPELFGGAAD